MSKLHGWNRIYLFYGLIFFLLGFASSGLSEIFLWEQFAGGFQTFISDLAPYAGWKMSSASPDIMVMAQPETAPVCFLYTNHLRANGFTPILNQCRKELERQCVKLQSQGVTADFEAVFQRWVRENPRSIIIGLKVREPSAGGRTQQIDLKLSAADLAFVPLMERAVEVLRDQPSLTFRLQKRIPNCLEVSWQEAGGVDSKIPTTVGLLLEVLPIRKNRQSSIHQL